MHRRTLRRFPFAALALFLLAAAAHTDTAHAQGNSLEGRVMLPNGTQPTNSVKVTLVFNGRRIHETFTDLSGRFAFSGLGSGTFHLTAEGDGTTFETTTVSAEVGIFGSGQTYTQNIQLRLKAGAAAAAPPGTISAAEVDPDVPERARDKYRQGLKQAAENRPEQAVKLFEEAVREHAKFYAAALALGEQYAKLQRHDDALAAYRRATEIKPDRAEAYVGVGVSLAGLKKFEEAVKLLRGVVELDKNLPGAYLPLGYAEMMTGDHAAAERHLLRALELDRPALAHVYLAHVYEQTGEPAKAVGHLEAYLKEQPQSLNAAAVRGAIEKLRRKAKDKK
jgi:Tfp pilus assembly protein PilF